MVNQPNHILWPNQHPVVEGITPVHETPQDPNLNEEVDLSNAMWS